MILLRQRYFSKKEKKNKIKSSKGLGTAVIWSAPSFGLGLPGALIGRKAGMKKAEKEDNYYDQLNKGGRRAAAVGGLSGAAIGAAIPTAIIASSAISKKGKKISINKKELKKALKYEAEIPAVLGGIAGGISGHIGASRGARRAIADDALRKAFKENKKED